MTLAAWVLLGWVTVGGSQGIATYQHDFETEETCADAIKALEKLAGWGGGIDLVCVQK